LPLRSFHRVLHGHSIGWCIPTDFLRVLDFQTQRLRWLPSFCNALRSDPNADTGFSSLTGCTVSSRGISSPLLLPITRGGGNEVTDFFCEPSQITKIAILETLVILALSFDGIPQRVRGGGGGICPRHSLAIVRTVCFVSPLLLRGTGEGGTHVAWVAIGVLPSVVRYHIASNAIIVFDALHVTKHSLPQPLVARGCLREQSATVPKSGDVLCGARLATIPSSFQLNTARRAANQIHLSTVDRSCFVWLSTAERTRQQLSQAIGHDFLQALRTSSRCRCPVRLSQKSQSCLYHLMLGNFSSVPRSFTSR
jgi:hypothetical protein